MADFLSRLPESLIHHILSFLPFNQIYRTCVLSKYFNSVWCNYPNLDFVFVNPYLSSSSLTEEDLLYRMENSLGQCLVRKRFIQQLSLHISSRTVLNNLTPNLDRWLCLSVEKNVSRLVLRHHISDSSWTTICYSVPNQVLVARRLEVLDLSFCIFKEHSFVRIELPCLEKLCLFRCHFVGDNLLQKILCGSPKIKHVSLEHCTGLLEISSPSLKRLIFHGFIPNDIRIDAPNLHSFELLLVYTFMMSSEFKFSSWSIPKTDDIHFKFSVNDFQNACRAGLQDFLMKLQNYEDLKLLIVNKRRSLIMIKELHAVSFSSLQMLAENSTFKDIFISSRDETNLVHKLSYIYGCKFVKSNSADNMQLQLFLRC